MLVLYVVWGSTYLGIAIAVETIPPFIMAGTRFFIAGVILLAWSFVRGGGSIPSRAGASSATASSSGSLLLGAGMGLVAFGEQTRPLGITALLIAMMPVWVAILGRVLFAERLPALAIVGIVVGFAGVAILAGPSVFGSTDALDPIGLAAIIISPIAWATGSLYASHRAVLPSQPLVATGIQMFCGGAILSVVGALSGEFGRFDITGVSSASLLAMVYLTGIGSLLAFTAYGWLLAVAPLPLVATYAYVNPVVAVLLGAFVLHEADRPADPRRRHGHRRRGRAHRHRPRPDAGPAIRVVADALEAPSPTTSAHLAGHDSLAGPPSAAGPRPALGRPRLAADRPVLAITQCVVGLDERVELARPLVDDRGLRVAQVALDRELVRVAVGAVDLDGVERALDRVLRRVPLGQARLACVAQYLVLEPAGLPDEEPAHLGAGGHLRDHLLDQLVLADLLPEVCRSWA